jgi:hypothetical protein
MLKTINLDLNNKSRKFPFKAILTFNSNAFHITFIHSKVDELRI